jgi:TctA family transporter
MIDGKPGFRAIVRINTLFVVAFGVLGYGSVFWQWASPVNWGAGLIAILSGFAGVSVLIRAVSEMVGLILHNRKIRRFSAQGGKTRGDPMAGKTDLKKRGMIR